MSDGCHTGRPCCSSTCCRETITDLLSTFIRNFTQYLFTFVFYAILVCISSILSYTICGSFLASESALFDTHIAYPQAQIRGHPRVLGTHESSSRRINSSRGPRSIQLWNLDVKLHQSRWLHPFCPVVQCRTAGWLGTCTTAGVDDLLLRSV